MIEISGVGSFYVQNYLSIGKFCLCSQTCTCYTIMYESQFYFMLTTGELYPLVENFMAEFQDNLKHRLPCAVILNEILTNHVELTDGTL